MKVLTLILYLCVAYAASRVKKKDKIVFAMDHRPGLNPTRRMHISHLLFDIYTMKGPDDLRNDTNIIAYANYTALSEIYHASKLQIPTYIENPPAVMELFNDKAAWKAWMAEIGLGASVPAVLDNKKRPEEHQYPLVLKTNVHFGRGVFIVHNSQDLRNITTTLAAEGKTYLMEEALMGLGLSEITIWGSAFRGELLSLRCVRLTFSEKDVIHSAFRNSSVHNRAERAVNGTSVPFVRGFQAQWDHEQWLPCGQDMVSIARTMMAAANYTGSWCTMAKLDAQKRPKLMEVNARFCGSMAANDALFLTSFVPLAAAIGRAFPHSKVNYALHNGTLHHVFHLIRKQEERVMLTGGGPYKGEWITAEKFDPALRLDVIHDTFNHMVKHHK